jgi:arylsulfatase A-like enzyme
MDSRRLCRGLLLLVCLSFAACEPVVQETEDALRDEAVEMAVPRIVLLISLDTLRADHLSLYGYERNTSPFLEVLATESVVFDDASSPAPWTLPSHASMLTGLYPRRHGVMTWTNALADEIPTLVDWLKPLGYQTGSIVGAPWLRPETHKVTRGFDRHLFIETAPDRRNPNRWASDTALEWLREADGERIFLFVHYFDTHLDYASEPAYERLFVEPYDGPADGTGWQVLRANLPEDYVKFCSEHFDVTKCRFGSPQKPRMIDENLERVSLDDEDVRHLENLYDAGIRQLDTELGRFVSKLRSEGFLDETLLIITSDHGEEFRDHGRLDHFIAMYQESLRVPLLIRGPGLPAGVRIGAPVSLVDLAPTILAQTGNTARAETEGLDLTPLWSPPDAETRDAAEAHKPFDERFLYGEAGGGLTLAAIAGGDFFRVYRSVRRGPHKLITESHSDQAELYDLTHDPGERNNLADQRPEILEELSAELERRSRLYGNAENSENRFELDEASKEQLRDLGYLVP